MAAGAEEITVTAETYRAICDASIELIGQILAVRNGCQFAEKRLKDGVTEGNFLIFEVALDSLRELNKRLKTTGRALIARYGEPTEETESAENPENIELLHRLISQMNALYLEIMEIDIPQYLAFYQLMSGRPEESPKPEAAAELPAGWDFNDDMNPRLISPMR